MIEFSNPIADEDPEPIIDYEKEAKEWEKCTSFIGKLCLCLVCSDFIAIMIFVYLYRDEL